MKCTLPFTDISIKRDGRVRVCCYNEKILGDLNTQTLEEIWSGAEYQELRKRIEQDDFSYGCIGHGCPMVGKI